MVSIRRTSAVLLLWAVGAAPPAFADDAAEAKSAYMSASRFFQAEEYEAALPFFEKAYRLSGQRPATIFALAQCERSLKRYREARAHFQEYLATDPANASDVRETIALLDDLIQIQDAAETKRKAEAAAEAERIAAEQAAAQKKKDAEAAERARVAAAKARPSEPDGRVGSSETAEEDLGPAPGVVPDAPPVAPAPKAQPKLTATAPPPPAEEDSGGILSSPWFWTITSIVVVSGAVTGGVLLSRGSEPDVYGGSTGVVLGN